LFSPFSLERRSYASFLIDMLMLTMGTHSGCSYINVLVLLDDLSHFATPTFKKSAI